MEIEIPELLLQLPVVSIPTEVEQSAQLVFALELQEKHFAEYRKEVSKFVMSHNLHAAQLVPSIEFAMRVYCAENYTGELGDGEVTELESLTSRFHFGAEVHNTFVQRLLVSDGEMPSPIVKYASLLLLCLALVDSTTADGTAVFSRDNIWCLRVHFRHQLALQRRAHSIFLRIAECVDAVLSDGESLSPSRFLEVGYVQNYYHQRELAAANFLHAKEMSGLITKETSIMGVRTRWQKTQHVQQMLEATSSTVPSTPDGLDQCPRDQPQTIMGEQDGHDLYDRPRESTGQAEFPLTPLQNIDKAILLALCINIKNNNPFHGITTHHIQTYIERLIADPHPAPYVLASQCLLTRSRLEHGRSRVQQRAYMQMQELVDQYSCRRNPELRTFHRTEPSIFFITAFPSVWDLKVEFANFCFDENLYKTALTMYEEVLDWENILECCKKLDKRKKAESLARDLLDKDPQNPALYVALGEATREDAYLWKAWELSGHKMAAPMRALAKLAVEREHYDKVVEYFDTSVRINPLFGGDWFTLGYAALRLKNLERSAEAFTRVCQMDPNDAFAWNNLSSIMLEQGKTRPAFNAMNQALHNNRRNWRMWQNYFAIGVELGELMECTHALNIALEIAKREIRLETQSMKRFVVLVIRYVSGENEGAVEEGNEDSSDGAIQIVHLAPNDEEKQDDALETGMEELKPFGFEVELPDTFFPDKKKADEEAARAAKLGMRRRYVGRVRSIFQTILNLFVGDPELYACAATLMGYLDGPLVGFEYRIKELRCAMQADQWERDEAKFTRVVECLQAMLENATDAVRTEVAGLEVVGKLPKSLQDTPRDSAGNGAAEPLEAEEGASGQSAAAEPTVGVAAIRIRSGSQALELLQNDVKGVLASSTEYMKSTKPFFQLKILRDQIRESRASLL